MLHRVIFTINTRDIIAIARRVTVRRNLIRTRVRNRILVRGCTFKYAGAFIVYDAYVLSSAHAASYRRGLFERGQPEI